METTEPLIPVSDIVTDLIRGNAPLKMALDLWRSHHGFSYERVSRIIGRKKGAVSAWINRPDRLSRIGRDISDLIGYEQRGDAAQ